MTILKIIVACLALANAGYFLWAHGIAKTQEAAVAPTTLKLASEAGAAPRAAEPTPDGTAAAAPGSGSANAAGAGDANSVGLLSTTHCITVGPFHEVSEAAHAASTLRGAGYDPRQRVVDGDVWAGVWVYIAIPGNAAAGEQMLAKLKAAGVEDALEMPGPADGSVISLGLFSEPRRAQSRVAQAQALGFSPALVDRKRTGNVYWIDIDLKPSDGLLNPADLEGEAGHISRLEMKACPAPAVQP